MSKKPIRISRRAAGNQNADMTGKNIVITGATAGIGKETARILFTKSDLVNDEALRDRLWKISEELVDEEFCIGAD